MLSRKALDDFEAFLVSLSACFSGVSSSCNVEVADTYREADREAIEGDLGADGDSVWDVLVFRTWSGRSGGPMPDCAGSEDVFAGEGRAGEGLAVRPRVLNLSGIAFLGVTLVSGAPLTPPPIVILCLEDSNLIFEGLSLLSGAWLVGRDEADGTDMRDRDGRRNLDTGWDNKSLLTCPEDDRAGDLE